MLGDINKNMYNERFVKNEYYNGIGNRIEKVIGLFDRHDGKILDVGCGDGLISGLIGKKTGAKMYGVDVADEAVRISRKRGIDAKIFDVNKKIPFRSSYFDAVYCGEVLEHVFDVDNLIDEIKRVLKPRGYAVITVPNIAAWYNRGLMLLGYLPFWVEASIKNPVGSPFAISCGHVRAFTKSALAQLFRIHGFRIEAVTGAYINVKGVENKTPQRIASRIISIVDRMFSRFPSLSTNVILKAVK
ncbi:MAG: class I SAM-dependent methyltransferase [Candidatus Aenigmarchaeota archaeon]|nr:class I SAM-dependent methyltransferase [Candidatus Aenigmarchaeota archaeon]